MEIWTTYSWDNHCISRNDLLFGFWMEYYKKKAISLTHGKMAKNTQRVTLDKNPSMIPLTNVEYSKTGEERIKSGLIDQLDCTMF